MMFRLCFKPNRFGSLSRYFSYNIADTTRRKLIIQTTSMALSTKARDDQVMLSKNLSLTQNKQDSNKAERTLVLLFSWMLAQDKHLKKYIQFYSNYGFDILVVKTDPLQLVFPRRGSIKNAEEVVQFIKGKTDYYSKLIVHGFSVGAYQFGEVLVKMSEDKTFASQTEKMWQAMIFDSAANLAAIPDGFSRALTSIPILQKLLCQLLNLYLRLFYYVATKYYEESEKEFNQMNHFRVPSLMLVSERDKIGSIASNQEVMDSWVNRGIPVKMKIWKDSKHVSHYHKYPEEYEQELKRIIEETSV